MKKFSTTQKLSSTEYLILAIIILLAFALRIFQLDAQSLRGDEAISAVYAAMPLQKMLTVTRTFEPHPPLFYFILGGWEKLTGFSEFALRYAALMAGVLTVPILFALTRRIIGKQTAFFAAFLLSVNSFHIWYSQDIRSYPWLVLVGVWASWLVWQGFKRPRKSIWIAYAFSVTLMFYLHYYALFIIAFHGVFALWLSIRKKLSKRQWFYWLGSNVAALLILIPWLSVSWQYIASYTGNFEPASPWAVFWRGVQAFNGEVVPPVPHLSVVMWLGLVLVFLGLMNLWRWRRDALVFWLAYIALTFIGIAILSLRGLAFTERYLLAALPGYVGLMAAGAAWLWQQKRLWSRGVFIGLMGFLLWQNAVALRQYWFNPALAKAPQWRETFDFIAETYNPKTDALVFNFPETAVSYYLDLQHPDSHPPAFLVPTAANPSPTELDTMLRETLQNYRRAYFVPVNIGGWDDAHRVETWLNRYADKLGQADFHWATAGVFLTPSAIETEMTRQSVHFENGIALEGFRVANDTAKNNADFLGSQPLDLRLYWKTAPTNEPLTVFVQLIDDTGFRRGGSDSQPVNGSYPTTEWGIGERVTDSYLLSLDAGTPTQSRYQVWVGFYNPKTGERVSVVDAAGNPIADHIVLNYSINIPVLE